ncbi:PRC-barrel domain-containing protein [Herbidospora daliensis]|uniref:PRC-barrel domain-containing protein n=1 Tax=Herbidospora daliensis TaxID=295585 RepID=UPI0007852636|nr:PRC-barrel domain-containing protein [Herbidospora daliensis]
MDENGLTVNLIGYHVEAVDGRIGTVDAVSDEIGEGYLVVDTGPWIFGHRVILPASVITQVDASHRKIYVDRTQKEISDAPDFITADDAPQRPYAERFPYGIA